MKPYCRCFLVAELGTAWFARTAFLALGLLLAFGPVGFAQVNPPVVVIPIIKERVPYYNISEDGTRISCGIRLLGSFPVYKGRTNLNDYSKFIPGVQNPGPWKLDTDGRFRFYAYFNGRDGPASSADCPSSIGETLPDWHAEYQPKRPVASFTSTPVASTPGEWDFLSTSTDAEEQPLIEQWVFGDGTDGSGKKTSHRYTKPGSFAAALTVMDTDGLTNRATRTISVPAPKALVSLVLLNKHPLNQIEIDEEFDVRIDVKASDDGVGPLSELVFTSTNALQIPSQFKILQSSSGTNIGTLQPGKGQGFTWTLKATNGGSFALVASGVRGKDAAGRTVTGVGETESGEVTSLIVGITQIPPILKLGADNNGDGKTNDLDNILQMVVGITNVSKQDVVSVETSNFNDPIKFTSLAETINVWVVPDDVPPGFFGTIKPGAANAVIRTNTYLASDKTYAEAGIVLHGKTGDAAVGAAGLGILNVGGGKLVEARFNILERPYQAGQPVRVFGTLKNVSRYRDRNGGVVDEGKTVGVSFSPEIEGNGALGYITPADYGGRTPVGPVPIFLAPGDTLDISAIIATAMVTNQETSLTLTYSALGYVHEEGQKPRRTRPGEIEIVLDSEKGWSPQHLVKLEGLQPTPTWEPCSLDLEFDPYVECRLRDGLTTAGGALKDLVFLAKEGVGVIAENTLKLAAFEIWLMQQTWDAIEDPAAQQRLDQEIAIDIQALKDFGYESLQGVAVGLDSVGLATHQSIQRSKEKFKKGNFKEIAGDVAEFVGENPDLPFEALTAARSLKRVLLLRHGEESVAKIALRESLEKQRAKLPGDVEEFAAKNGGSLDGLAESGVLPNAVEVGDQPRIYRDGMGTATSEVNVFKRVAKKYRVNIAWRSRAAKALEYLEALTHLLKPHGISIKTVSEIDWKYLGYPEKFLAECVLVEPPITWIPKDSPQYQNVIDNFLNRFPDLTGGDVASKELRLQVEERLKFQLEEYPKQIANFKKYVSEGIDTNFKAYKQFEPGSTQEKLSKRLLPDRQKSFRRAQIEVEKFNDPFTGEPRESYRLKMEDGPNSGVFKPITGDIDIIAILNLDGSVPGFIKRILIYKELIAEGMQHGESFSFLFDKELRAKFLRCCTPKALGGDGGTMLAATPFGQVLTTQFFDNLSLVEGGANNALAVGKDSFAFLAGVTSAMGKEIPELIPSLEIINTVSREAAPYVSASALARMVEELNAEVSRDNGTPIRMGADGQPEIYSPTSDPQSPELRSLGELPAISRRGHPAPADATTDALEGALARLVTVGWRPVRTMPPPGSAGGQWRPVTADQARNGPAGQGIKIAPYTYITSDLSPGTLVLPVISPTDLGLPAQSQFFAVGDQVVIDPGGPTEEFATLVNTTPLTLSRPLQFLKEAGTTVLFLRGISNAGSLPGALPAQENLLVWLRADAGLSITNGTNVISWTDQSRNGFVFTAPSAATRPEWVTDSAPGVPAVRFNSGSTPRLQGNLGRSLSNATIFTVARYLNNSSGGRYIYAFGTINYSGLMMTLGRNDGDNAYHYDGAAGRIAPNAIPGTGFYVFSQVYAGDSHQLAVDGHTVIESRTTVGRDYSAVATNVVLGKYLTATFGFTGDLAEWIVYDRALSTEERLEVDAYLRQRAQLAPVVPAGGIDVSASEIFDYEVTPAPAAAWSLDLGNRQLKQVGPGDPSLVLSGSTESGQVIRTKVRGTAGSGALGVVFGYQHRGQFHLFDWRQTASTSTNAGWGTAPAGMRLRSFHLPAGAEPTGADFWSGLDLNHVTTWRTNAVPWVPDREYEIVLRFGPDSTVVEVNFGASNLETWSVPELRGISGPFGHYANSMPEARFGPVLRPGEKPLITGIEPSGDGNWTIGWLNGASPFVVESTTDLSSGDWNPVAPATLNFSQTIHALGETQLFRVRSAGVVPDSSGAADSGLAQTFGNNGSLWLVKATGPTRIEAENYDQGGEGVAYHDTTAANSGGFYRTEAVDIGETVDFGGGYAVGSTTAGEWLEYTIRVEATGAYRLRARTARGASGSRTLRFLFNGVDKTGNLVIPATGNWASYATVESGAFELTAGTHIVHADMASGGFDLNWIEIAPDQPVVQSTFGNNGNLWTVDSTNTTRIEAENFDQGGQDVAYHETTPQNVGGAYRAEAVDIYTTSDSAGGHTVGSTAVGEWLEYTIQVEKAGEYRLRARTARGQSGTRTVRFLFDGVDKTGNLVIPATGNSESYTTVESGRFALSNGTQVLRVDMTSSDFNLNWIELVPVIPVAQSTFGNNGNPWSFGPPTVTRIEAENFDQGGADIAYHDTDSANQGSAYRSEDVDIQPTTDTGGGFNVGWTEAGEWLEYTIDVAVAGTYQLRFRTARAPAGSSRLRVLVNGVDKTGDVTIPRTVGTQTWTTVTKTGVNLEAGIQRLRIEIGVGAFNFNWFEIAP